MVVRTEPASREGGTKFNIPRDICVFHAFRLYPHDVKVKHGMVCLGLASRGNYRPTVFLFIKSKLHPPSVVEDISNK